MLGHVTLSDMLYNYKILIQISNKIFSTSITETGVKDGFGWRKISPTSIHDMNFTFDSTSITGSGTKRYRGGDQNSPPTSAFTQLFCRTANIRE